MLSRDVLHMRTDIEQNLMIKAIDSFSHSIIVISPNFKILSMNKARRRQGSVCPGQLCHKALHNRDVPCSDCLAVKVLKTKKSAGRPEHAGMSFEKGSCLHSYPILSKGKITALVILDFPISTMEKIEEKHKRQRNLADLQTEQSRIRTIIETLPNGVLVTNISGEIVLMNLVAQEYLGLSPDREVGKKIETCIKDRGLCEYIMETSQCLYKDDEEILPYELVLPEERFVLARGKAVLGEGGECMGAVVTLSDITTLKVFDRLKSEFVAKVSHELRSPLSIIHEQLAMVIKGKSRNHFDDDQRILGRAKEKTQSLISMIGDLLDISRIEAGNRGQPPVKVQIDDLIEKIVDFLNSRAEKKNQSINLDLTCKNIPPVEADPIALESIFGNLIANAIKYTREGGKISVRVDKQEDDVRITIKDNGFGIEQKHLSKIFEKFYRIKDDNTRFINGTGLGLPIVKSLIDSLKGNIFVESKAGKGSIFTVLLPAVKHSQNFL